MTNLQLLDAKANAIRSPPSSTSVLREPSPVVSGDHSRVRWRALRLDVERDQLQMHLAHEATHDSLTAS